MRGHLWILAVVVVWAQPAEATTYRAANCELATVQALVNGAAASGDTITIPAGRCAWTGALTISGKSVDLIGAGSGPTGGTILDWQPTTPGCTSSGCAHGFIILNPGARVTDLMEIANIRFQKTQDLPVLNTTPFLDIASSSAWYNLRVHNNHFYRIHAGGNRDRIIEVNGAVYGVIDQNVFQGAFSAVVQFGLGAAAWNESLSTFQFGDADWLFVEDNEFLGGPASSWQWAATDMYSGARMVFRHNYLLNSYFLTHDKWRSGLVSAHAWEIYGNTFDRNRPGGWKAIDLTAGTGVVYDNTFKGSADGGFRGSHTYAIAFFDYKTAEAIRQLGGAATGAWCNGADPLDQNVSGNNGWRCQYQIGTHFSGANAISMPVYLWGNTCDGTVSSGCPNGGGVVDNATHGGPYPSSAHIRLGRDFINNNTTRKPGYTPYQHPHPLRSGGSSLSRTLDPPRNLRVVGQ